MTDAVLRFVGQDAGLISRFRDTAKELLGLEKQANATSGLINKGFGSVAGIVAGISFVRIANELFEYNEQLQMAASRTGIQIEQLQKLQFIATQSETSVEAITSSINKFQVNLVEGNEKSTKALNRLGISITELNALQPDQQFIRIAEAVAEIRSPAERSATAIALFGRGGAELIPLLSQGVEGIRALEAQFDEFGVTISTDTVKQVDEAGDAISRMGSAVKGLGVELLSLASGPIVAASDGITTFFKAVAFGLRGEGGGHGENEIANIDRDIELLADKVRRLSEARFVGNSLFSKDLNDLIQAQARLDALVARQRELLGLNPSPLSQIGIDPNAVQLPRGVANTIDKLGNPLSVDEKRRDALGADNNPVVIAALEEKDLLLQINREKLDEMLRQETEHSVAAANIESDLAEYKRQVRETFGLQEISFEQAKNSSLISLAGQLFGVLARENSKVARIQQALAIAQVIWDTSRAVMKALAEVPYPANIGVAAFLAAQGAIQIAKIRSTNYNAGGTSGGSISSVGGGSAAGTAQPPTTAATDDSSQAGRVVNVYLNGNFAGPDSIRWVMDEISEQINGADAIIFSSDSAQGRLVREGG